LLIWAAALAILGCHGRPTTLAPGKLEPWIEFGLVALDGEPEAIVCERFADAPVQPQQVRVIPPIVRCHVSRVSVVDVASGEKMLWLKLDRVASAKLTELTSRGLGRELAILVAGKVVLVPTIGDPLRDDIKLGGLPPATLQAVLALISSN
jgi:hypothetical protein